MGLSVEEFIQAIEREEILLYEEELLDRLRSICYSGLPLSIMVLCFSICNTNCYPTSVHLTRGMESFQLIHGNINIYPKNLECPNHSWVEKDGYVYDPTDGHKWKKELYYRVFEPEVLEVYDENTVKDYAFYQDVITRKQEVVSEERLALMLQYLEILENDHPTINYNLLLEEIELCRKKNHITIKYDSHVMKKYRQLMEKKN